MRTTHTHTHTLTQEKNGERINKCPDIAPCGDRTHGHEIKSLALYLLS